MIFDWVPIASRLYLFFKTLQKFLKRPRTAAANRRNVNRVLVILTDMASMAGRTAGGRHS